MNVINATAADWKHIEPLLDEAVSALDETDRAAVLLRYFENKSLREVGATLGTSDDAAQKRVSRAVERLREFFAKRGITVGASGLVVVISTNAVQAAPVGLTAAISAAAVLTGTAVSTSTAIAVTKTIAMTTLQKALVTATVAVVAGVGIYEARQVSRLRDQVQTLQLQNDQLKTESESLSNRPTPAANAKSLPDEQFNELLRLRGEVGVLRRQKMELENSLSNLRNPKPTVPNSRTEQQPSRHCPTIIRRPPMLLRRAFSRHGREAIGMLFSPISKLKGGVNPGTGH